MGSRDWIRLSFAAVLFVLAGLPLLFLWMDLERTGSAVEVAQTLVQVSKTTGLILAGLSAALLVIYPPALPSLRILFRDMRNRMTVDRGPMIAALSRINDFEIASDQDTIARTYLQSGDPVRAFQHASRAVELDSDSLRSRYLLGQILHRAKEHAKAAQVFRDVLDREANYAFGEAKFLLGKSLANAGGQDALAQAIFEEHEREHGPDRRALLVRARLAARLGQPDLQMRLLRDAARAPNDGERIPLDHALARAQARVLLWRGGAGGKTTNRDDSAGSHS